MLSSQACVPFLPPIRDTTLGGAMAEPYAVTDRDAPAHWLVDALWVVLATGERTWPR